MNIKDIKRFTILTKNIDHIYNIYEQIDNKFKENNRIFVNNDIWQLKIHKIKNIFLIDLIVPQDQTTSQGDTLDI